MQCNDDASTLARCALNSTYRLAMCGCVQFMGFIQPGTAVQEAMMKQFLADSIFDDIIEDTAEALLEATGEQL